MQVVIYRLLVTDLGKIDRTFFERHVSGSLGAERGDVRLGPQHGVDFGVIDVGDQAVVIATDPLSIVPKLGLERATRFGLDIVLADVAVSGVSPSHLSVCFTLPPEMDDDAFATVQSTIHDVCRDLGVSVVSGHTARYTNCSFPWIATGTAIGIGTDESIIRPDGARVGDRLLLTTGPGVEAVGLLATLFGDDIDLPPDVLQSARERMADVYCTRDAMAVGATGAPNAIHDVTEGGLAGALNEMAAGAGFRFDVDRNAVPLRPGVEAFCAHFDVDPWHLTSCGSLLIAVPTERTDEVREVLENRGTVVADIGTVEPGDGVFVDGKSLVHPDCDPSWELFADLADR